MAVKKKNTKKAETGTQSQAPAARSQSELRIDEVRQKALEMFHPTVIEWFKEKLNLDLASPQFPLSDLYKLGRGELTDPVKMVVIPKAYSAEQKGQVNMPPIQVVASIRATFPNVKGQPVALDDKNQVFLQTVPCRPFAELAAPGEEIPQAPRAEGEQREAKFTESQMMCLEGIGISRERLYGGFNHLSRQEKLDILDGEVFPVEGNVKTDFGFVNVMGQARLTTDENGKASVVFEPNYPDKRAEGLVVDIDRARIIGMLELDVYARTPDGKIKTDVNGARVLNRAGENLLEFGAALEPVTGRLHKRQRTDKGTWKETYETKTYNVKVVNGNFFASLMPEKEVMVDGVKTKVAEISNARIKDDKIFVLGQKQPLEFGSAADRESMLQGKGGIVKGATFKDFKTQKEIVYDAFAYINESGFAEKFSPATTEKIVARKKAQVAHKTSVRKKTRFGVTL